jgi:hypothetical protein
MPRRAAGVCWLNTHIVGRVCITAIALAAKLTVRDALDQQEAASQVRHRVRCGASTLNTLAHLLGIAYELRPPT